MEKTRVRANKKFFESKKQAIEVSRDRRTECFKMKHGRNKGKFFVGSWIEWVNQT